MGNNKFFSLSAGAWDWDSPNVLTPATLKPLLWTGDKNGKRHFRK